MACVVRRRSDRHWRGHRRMVLVAFKAEVARLDQFQPLGLVNARLGEFRHTVGDHQLRRGQWFALELFVEHVQVVLIDVRIADEVSEPAWRVTGQTAHQRQQCSAFGEVERRAKKAPPPTLLHITLTCNAFQATLYMGIISFAHYLSNP